MSVLLGGPRIHQLTATTRPQVDQTCSMEDEVIMDKYKIGKYRRGYFCGGSNRYFNLIMCEDKIVIPLTLQRYVLNWYHMHIHNQGEDRTEAMICQKFHWPGIR